MSFGVSYSNVSSTSCVGVLKTVGKGEGEAEKPNFEGVSLSVGYAEFISAYITTLLRFPQTVDRPKFLFPLPFHLYPHILNWE